MSRFASAVKSAPARAPWWVLFLVLACAGCTTRTIYNVHEASFPEHAPMADDEIAAMIREAGERQGWHIESKSPGVMRGRYSQGRHRAVVEIQYSATGFGIFYLDSSYLKYDGHSIHAIYNEWVKQLEAAIQREANFRMSAASPG